MAKRKSSVNHAEMMQIIEAWKAHGGRWPVSASEIASFAISKRLFGNTQARLMQLCARELAKAMREEHIKDARGRPVRKLHAARFPKPGDSSKQLTLWDDIDTADHEFMEVAFKQRREQIVGDCCQLNNDVEYYNENRCPPEKKPIQLVFNFTDDVAEANMPEEYPSYSAD